MSQQTLERPACQSASVHLDRLPRLDLRDQLPTQLHSLEWRSGRCQSRRWRLALSRLTLDRLTIVALSIALLFVLGPASRFVLGEDGSADRPKATHASAAHGDADNIIISHSCAERPQDEVWLVSARRVGCVDSGDKPHLETQRYDSETGWNPGDITELFQPSAPDQMLVMYIHGNRVETQQAAYEGRYVYRLLTSQIDDPVSIRYVIWSWPSERLQGQLRDVRVKAARTELGGYSLGWFLAKLPRDQRVSLLSYSFGARIATGALHLLGGGQLSGRCLPPPTEQQGPQTRVVMLAAALHRNWLRPGCYHEMAFSHMDFLLNLYNSCDPVLKRYRFLYKGSRPEAIGFTGMYTGDLGPMRNQIEQRNMQATVQKSHAAIHYFENRPIKRRIQQVLFWRALHGEVQNGEVQNSEVQNSEVQNSEHAHVDDVHVEDAHGGDSPSRVLDHNAETGPAL